jgi:hypothetical protein
MLMKKRRLTRTGKKKKPSILMQYAKTKVGRKKLKITPAPKVF